MSPLTSTPKNLVDSSGKLISVSQLLGRGGEGSVYSLTTPDLVVKVYHDPINQAKQDKLTAMMQGRTADLLRIATWPVDTVHDAQTRRMVGFTMPKLSGFKEIHTLYSPVQRKQDYPDADWSFLVQAARNAAAAIGSFHSMGHVVGDINPKNLVVSKDATVKLIDCDSFQIHSPRGQFLCEVGVPHFTPPELQGKSLSKTVRTANHDGFGLALICFHLLFMGRHPFAGRYQNGNGEMPLEKAIREFRFAYGSSASLKQMAPPPNVPSMTIIPGKLQTMFDIAFGQAGVWGKRPSATDWIQELDAFRQSLRNCTFTPLHKYPRYIGECPWCLFETHASVYYFPDTGRSSQPVTYDIDAVWATIRAVVAPGPAQLPDFNFTPLAQEIRTPLGATPKQLIDFYQERLRLLQATVMSVTLQLSQLQASWAQHRVDRSFQQKFEELRQVRIDCSSLLIQYYAERNQREQQARDIQLREYLKKYLVEHAKISGIGSARVATLTSYGIETAADVTQSQIQMIPGFGPTLTYELLKWRKALETNFKFDSRKVVQQQTLIQLDLRVAAKLAPFQKALGLGAGELEKIRQNTLAQRQQLIHDIHLHSKILAQAKVDLSYIETELHSAQHQQLLQQLEQRRRLLIQANVRLSQIKAKLQATQHQQQVDQLEQRRRLLTQAKVRLSHIEVKLRAAQDQVRIEKLARTRKQLVQLALSIPIALCLIAVVAFINSRNFGPSGNWQATPTVKIQTSTTQLVPSPTNSPMPATATLPPTSTVSPTPRTPIVSNTVIATTTMVSRVYETPSTDSSMIVDIPQGTQVTIIGRITSNILCKARLLDGREGWLYCIFLNTNAPLNDTPVVSPTIQ